MEKCAACCHAVVSGVPSFVDQGVRSAIGGVSAVPDAACAGWRSPAATREIAMSASSQRRVTGFSIQLQCIGLRYLTSPMLNRFKSRPLTDHAITHVDRLWCGDRLDHLER